MGDGSGYHDTVTGLGTLVSDTGAVRYTEGQALVVEEFAIYGK